MLIRFCKYVNCLGNKLNSKYTPFRQNLLYLSLFDTPKLFLISFEIQSPLLYYSLVIPLALAAIYMSGSSFETSISLIYGYKAQLIGIAIANPIATPITYTNVLSGVLGFGLMRSLCRVMFQTAGKKKIGTQ